MRPNKHFAAALCGLCSMLMVLGLGFPRMADAQHHVRMSVFPKRLNYGDVPLTSHETQSVTVTNESNVDIEIASILADPNPTFSVTYSTCPVSPDVLPAGASCLVSVDFTPQGIGKVSGLLTFTDSASNSPQNVNLVGNGVPAP